MEFLEAREELAAAFEPAVLSLDGPHRCSGGRPRRSPPFWRIRAWQPGLVTACASPPTARGENPSFSHLRKERDPPKHYQTAPWAATSTDTQCTGWARWPRTLGVGRRWPCIRPPAGAGAPAHDRLAAESAASPAPDYVRNLPGSCSYHANPPGDRFPLPTPSHQIQKEKTPGGQGRPGLQLWINPITVYECCYCATGTG